MRLRKTIVFDRFLARLVAVASNRWVLKGAVALDLRLGSGARTTKDLDLACLDNEDAAAADFLAAQARDLGDFFIFVVRRTPALDTTGDFSAVRYRVNTELAGRRFEEFPVDVAFSNSLAWHPDRLRGTDLLAFAGIERIELSVLPLEQHLAEKFHAYTSSYGTDSSPSTRPKDLIDIVLVKHSAPLNAAALRTALDATFTTRSRQALPSVVPAPPAGWRVPYAKLADAVALPTALEQVRSEAAALLDPVLAGKARGDWDPATGAWIAAAESRPEA